MPQKNDFSSLKSVTENRALGGVGRKGNAVVRLLSLIAGALR